MRNPDAGKDWGQEEKGATEDEMARCITNSIDMSLSKLQEMVKNREVWHSATLCMEWQRVGHDLTTEQQQTSWCVHSTRACSLGHETCSNSVSAMLLTFFTDPIESPHSLPPFCDLLKNRLVVSNVLNNQINVNSSFWVNISISKES